MNILDILQISFFTATFAILIVVIFTAIIIKTKKYMPVISAEATFEQKLQILDVFVTFVEDLRANTSDLTADEIEAKWAPYQVRIDALQTPPDPNA
jgi:hypothetical protein